MNIETYQSRLKDSIEYFVNIGMSINHAYPLLWPSEQGNMLFGLVMAARRLNQLLMQAVRLQEMSLSDVTGLDLIEIRGQLLSLNKYLEQGDFDLDISYSYNENSRPLFDPSEIVEEENLDNLFPKSERTAGITNARKLLIATAKEHYNELTKCIDDIVGRIEKLIADLKMLKRHPELRLERMTAMEQYYQKHYWPQDRKLLEDRIEGELRDEDNKNKTATQIIQGIIKDLEADNERSCSNHVLQFINHHRYSKEKVALLAVEKRNQLSFDDMMQHLKYRESRRLLEARIARITLLSPCQEYQGKLFKNQAAYELAKLLGKAFYNYVGFDKKIKAAFIFAAMRDLCFIYKDENNARLMADFINTEWLGEKDDSVNDDAITRPLRKCAGSPFCMIDEFNLRSFEVREFEKYKDLYWRAYSIINKVLVISENVETAPYLDEMHPVIEDVDVINYLSDDEKARINFINTDACIIWG